MRIAKGLRYRSLRACLSLMLSIRSFAIPALIFIAAASSAGAAEIRGAMDKCLEVNRKGNGADGTPVILNTCDGSEQQSWQLDNGLIRGAGGKCLDAYGGDLAGPGAPIKVYPCHGRPNQRWAVSGDTIRGNFGLCLNIKGGLSGDGAPTILWPCIGTFNEKWKVNYEGYRPQELPTGLRLCNTTNRTVSAAFGYRTPRLEIQGGVVDGAPDIVTEGWYTIQPGDCALVHNQPVTGEEYYVYARAGDKRFTGDRSLCVKQQAFSLSDVRNGCAPGDRVNFMSLPTRGRSVTYEFRQGMDW